MQNLATFVTFVTLAEFADKGLMFRFRKRRRAVSAMWSSDQPILGDLWWFFLWPIPRLCQRLQGRSWHLQLARWSFLPGAMVRRKTVPWFELCLSMSFYVFACVGCLGVTWTLMWLVWLVWFVWVVHVCVQQKPRSPAIDSTPLSPDTPETIWVVPLPRRKQRHCIDISVRSSVQFSTIICTICTMQYNAVLRGLVVWCHDVDWVTVHWVHWQM